LLAVVAVLAAGTWVVVRWREPAEPPVNVGEIERTGETDAP
jgi:hypothetical protein